MTTSTTNDAINMTELVDILRDLRDSVRDQTALLKAFIVGQNGSHHHPQNNRKAAESPSRGDNHGKGDDDNDTHQTNGPIAAERDSLNSHSRIARRIRPLLHDRVAFYRKDVVAISVLREVERAAEPSFIDAIKSSQRQPPPGVVGNS